jgi:outer membrane protein OmpA-like peptidoglycan-associated protein
MYILISFRYTLYIGVKVLNKCISGICKTAKGMKQIFFLVLFATITGSSFSQNLLQNGGFEDIDTNCMNSHPHEAIPLDSLYGFELISCISPWGMYSATELVFNMDYRHTGHSAASVLLKNVEVPYQRSYAIAPLCMPLVAGNRYSIKFYYKAIKNNYYTSSSLAIAFAGHDSVAFNKYKPLYYPSAYTIPGFLTDTGWVEAKFTYNAIGGEDLLLIGNFATDKETKNRILNKDIDKKHRLRIVYALVDDISVLSLDNTDSCQPVIIKNSVSNVKAAVFDTGKTFVLDRIYFKSGSAELLEPSFPQLQKVAEYLNYKPKLTASITGHTDSEGNGYDNMQLSVDRAQAVANYLQELGVSARRLRINGKGEETPIAENDTQQGRQLNRRVEIVFRDEK